MRDGTTNPLRHPAAQVSDDCAAKSRRSTEGVRHPERPSPTYVVSVVAGAFAIAPPAVLDWPSQPAVKTADYLQRRACKLALAEAARVGDVFASRS